MKPDLFKMLTVRQPGIATIDNRQQATEKNWKTKKSNSKHVCPETLGAHAFVFDWAGSFNSLVPIVHLIEKTIKHFCSSTTGCKVILVCPYWTSATF